MVTTEVPTAAEEWIPIADAAQRLGVSQDAIRRRLKAGQLQGKREVMPQGFRWLILLDEGERSSVDGEGAQGGASHQVPLPPTHEGAQGGAEVATLARAQEMAAYSEALLAPWRQQVAELSRQVGRLEAELEQARALHCFSMEPQTRNGAASWPERRRWWQRLVWG